MDAPMNKTEQALAAIFRHCDEVAEGKRPPRSEKEGREDARAWLGVNVLALARAGAENSNEATDTQDGNKH